MDMSSEKIMGHISELAFIDPKAKLGKNVTVFPFAYIERDVEIGDDCVIYTSASIMRGTRMGRGNKIYQNTVIGATPQDFRYTSGTETHVEIGDENIFRENVVVNRATYADGVTKIGNRNFLMEGVHISHDTDVHDYCTFGYATKVAGDCLIHSGTIFSSGVIINAGVRIGDGAMVTSGVRLSRDVPPFIIATGYPVKYGGLNESLLKAAGTTDKVISHLANAYRLIFHGQTSVFDACIQVKEQVPDDKEVRTVVSFIQSTKLGIISKL